MHDRVFERRLPILIVGALSLIAGCATPRVKQPSLTAESGAANFESRSLSDAGLQNYLRENLGHPTPPWDFTALCWVGFYYQPSLELTRAQWETARLAERTARQRPNPTLALTPGYDFTHQDGVSPWMPSVGLDYLLSTAGKREHQAAAARNEAEAARQAIFTAAWKLRSDLRQALATATAASGRARLLQQQADVQRQVLALLQQRLTAGAIPATDVSAARTASLRAEAAAADANTQVATARVRVANVLGVPVSALTGLVLPAVPEPQALSPDALSAARKQSLRSRPDVLTALAKYEAAQHQLEVELAKRMPDVHLGPAYQWDQGLNKWSLGISFELPIFHQNEGPIAEAVSRRAEAAAQFNIVQNQAASEIDGAVAAVAAASAQLNRARELHEELSRQLTQANQRRALGAADALETEAARLEVVTAAETGFEAKMALVLAEGQLEDALQIPFEKIDVLTHPTVGEAQP